jgi:minor extracellular protease Epr
MGRPVQTFRKTAIFAALALFAAGAWSHEETESRDHETREDRSGPQQDDRRETELRSDNSGRGSSGSDDRREDSHDRAERRGSSARFEVERDTAGRERVRREVLMVADPRSIDTVRDAGFTIIATRPLTAFGETLARIRVRRGRSIEQVISELQALAPLASIAPDHLFRPSGEDGVAAAVEPAPAAVVTTHVGHVGVIDTGADVSWPALAHSIVQTEGFADGGYTSRTHGTLVSEIVARSGASLTVADVFGVDSDNRLIAPAAAIASAIDWLVAGGVRVINISIEGPDNFVLAHVIKRALAADVAIVAAAGNGGPAAAPAFPAAYPGVIAVTAVDVNGQVYRRANRGDYIAFAARGVDVESEYESATSKTKTVSGTSFAAPVVAAAIARRLDGGAGVGGVIDSLKSEARDLGAPGRDAIYGWGELEIPQTLTADSR